MEGLPIFSGPADHMRDGFRSLATEAQAPHPVATLQKMVSALNLSYILYSTSFINFNTSPLPIRNQPYKLFSSSSIKLYSYILIYSSLTHSLTPLSLYLLLQFSRTGRQCGVRDQARLCPSTLLQPSCYATCHRA